MSLTHGTVSGYIHHGCRCEPCRQARRDYYGHKSREEYLAERGEAPHGTASRYKRCKCDPCRIAANEARLLRRHADPDYTRKSRESKRAYRARLRATATTSAPPATTTPEQ